jgi:hypothetical protein
LSTPRSALPMARCAERLVVVVELTLVQLPAHLHRWEGLLINTDAEFYGADSSLADPLFRWREWGRELLWVPSPTICNAASSRRTAVSAIDS